VNPIAHLFYAPVTTIMGVVESARRTFSKDKAADCVFVIGPGQGMVGERLAWKALKEGLNAVVIGDGRNDITIEMIQKAREDGIIGNRTEVVCKMHGALRKQGEGFALKHLIKISHGVNNQGLISTKEFIHHLRQPLQKCPEKWQGNVHVSSCYIGALRGEIDIAEKNNKKNNGGVASLWRDGNILLYGGSKVQSSKVAEQNIESLLEHLGKRKNSRVNESNSLQESANNFVKIFNELKKDSATTLVLLDRNHKNPDVFRAPKTLQEVMPSHLNDRWRQIDANAKLDKKNNVNRSANPEKIKKSIFNPNRDLSYSEREKIIGFILTRVGHLRSQEKLRSLKADLKESPWLANIKNPGGITPLIYLAASGNLYPGSEVGSGEIARTLIDAGADLNASYSGETALDVAARKGNAEVLAVLLEKLSETGKLTHEHLSSSLRLACSAIGDRSAVIKAILSRFTGDFIDERDLFGRTVLHYAIMRGDVATVELLLNAGADFSKRTFGFSSPADLAREVGGEISTKILELLGKAKLKKLNTPH
jgi:ankyrin repeat protein